MPLWEAQIDDSTGKSVDSWNKYSDHLPVIMENEEWGRTTYQLFSVWHLGKEGIEKEYGLKFPLTFEQYNNLDSELKQRLGWFGYGHHGPNYVFVRRHFYDFIDKKQKFLIPCPIHNNSVDTVDISKIDMPDDLMNYVREGNAKILFYQDCEGFINSFSEIDWFESFCNKFNLQYGDVIVESANYKFAEVIKKWEFKHNRKSRLITQVNSQFEEMMWFCNPLCKVHTWDREKHYENFHRYLNYRRNFSSNKHFMCFARRFSPERAVIFHKVHTTPILQENSMYSLHNPYGFDHNTATNHINSLNLSTPFKNTVLNWFEQHFDYENGYSHDRSDQHTNWATVLPEECHRDTFVNVVIETHQVSQDDGEIFLSEKTFRPIYAAQPFLIFGNAGSLKTLKELGYKTFSDYWDESYDEPGHIEDRFNRFFSTMISIANRPLDELKEISADIEDRLIHNFNVLMDTSRLNTRLKYLYECCK